jgi:hypothetical protein
MKEHTPTTGTITFPAPRAGASRTHPTRRERKAQGLVRLGGSLPALRLYYSLDGPYLALSCEQFESIRWRQPY